MLCDFMVIEFKKPGLKKKKKKGLELKFKTLQKLSEILINVLWERKEFTIFLTKREREKKRSAVCFVFFLIFFFPLFL